MSHPEKCPLCDQKDETIDHLLISCVFVRQFWFAFLSQVNLQGISPQPNDRSFLDWWRRSNLVIVDTTRGLNSMFILGAWVLWKHRNRCVFETVVPSLAAALSQAREERVMWELVGGGGGPSVGAVSGEVFSIEVVECASHRGDLLLSMFVAWPSVLTSHCGQAHGPQV
jgi:hypothetical protein